jgi:hypothetical protein
VDITVDLIGVGFDSVLDIDGSYYRPALRRRMDEDILLANVSSLVSRHESSFGGTADAIGAVIAEWKAFARSHPRRISDIPAADRLPWQWPAKYAAPSVKLPVRAFAFGCPGKLTPIALSHSRDVRVGARR